MANGAPLYLRRLDRIDDLDIWRVDGHAIRDRIDVDFTNGHHHYSRRYVPIREIWVDRDAPGADEWRFWALRQAFERARMAKGEPYARAVVAAARHERQERRRVAGLADRTTRVTIEEVRAAAHRRIIGERAGCTVWLVDGRAVRDLAYVDFTLGGHGRRYRFIPRREIWIDDAVRAQERPAILEHELVELRHMAAGLSYPQAHELASRAERRFRRQGAAPARREAVK
jgi:hypothetical protein